MKKGVSLIALLITISVILVLTSTVVIFGNSIYNNSKKTKFATEISYIQELVDSYKLNNRDYPSDKTVFLDVSNIANSDIKEQFKDESISENTIVLNNIDYNKINSHELAFGNSTDALSDDRYFVSANTGKVYYMKGLKIGNKTYYSLTDDLKKHINYVEKNNANDGIIFNTKSSFNNQVNIDISIPSSYTDIQVTSSDQNFTFEVEKKEQYNIYKTTSLANSVITINYKINENDSLKELKYNVTNIDNESPTFSLSDIKILKNSDTNKEERYVSIENVNDNLSGIKCIKYVNFVVNDTFIEDYFKNRNIGVNIKNSDRNIIINDNVNFITVYVEDNAGNYSYEVKKVGSKNFDYINNGLILYLDGINNTRNGHITDTNVWEDLSDNNYDVTMENMTVNNNNMYFNGTDSKIYSNNSINAVSVELVLELEDTAQSYYIASFGSKDKILAWSPTNGKGFSLGHNKERYFVDNLYKLTSISAQYNPDKMYLNSERLEQNVSAESWGGTPSYPFMISGYVNGYRVKGKIYAVRVYNRALTEEEIQHNYKVDKLRFGIN